MKNRTIQRTSTKAESLDQLETRVGQLAARWRGADDAQTAAQIAQAYQTTLRTMIARGFTRPLDVDAELPDELMPAEYLRLFS